MLLADMLVGAVRQPCGGCAARLAASAPPGQKCSRLLLLLLLLPPQVNKTLPYRPSDKPVTTAAKDVLAPNACVAGQLGPTAEQPACDIEGAQLLAPLLSCSLKGPVFCSSSMQVLCWQSWCCSLVCASQHTRFAD